MGWDIVGHQAALSNFSFFFSSLSLTGYQRVVVCADDLTVTGDGTFVNLQLATAGTLRTTGYRLRIRAMNSAGSTVDQAVASTTLIRMIGGDGNAPWGVGNAASETGMAKAEISNLAAGNYKTVITDGAAVTPSGEAARYYGGGILEQTGAVDGFKVFGSNGTLAGGKVTVYGLTTG